MKEEFVNWTIGVFFFRVYFLVFLHCSFPFFFFCTALPQSSSVFGTGIATCMGDVFFPFLFLSPCGFCLYGVADLI